MIITDPVLKQQLAGTDQANVLIDEQLKYAFKSQSLGPEMPQHFKSI